MAFLIQEFGFEPDKTTIDFLSFPYPLTVSLFATTDKSAWTARIADYYKKEIVILLPLESHTPVPARHRKAVLMVHQPDHEIEQVLSNASACAPNYSGFCALYGSRFLEDTRATTSLLKTIKDLHGYFVDMNDAHATLGPSVARSLRLPYRLVDGAVERHATPAQIEQQLPALIRTAQKIGSALVTAPPAAAFIDVLGNAAPMLRRNGIKLVYVSDILNHYDN
jgi:polysaccharide deacetylase 2 family uncharacterized protein YibQ